MLKIFDTEYENIIALAASAALAKFNIDIHTVEIEIVFLDKEEIRQLNSRARGINKETDVLSFPAADVKLPFSAADYKECVNPENGCVILGEIAICEQVAREQAEKYGHSVSRELAFLTCHGTLHLLGFDHVNDNEQAEMENMTEEILNGIGLSREVTDARAEELAHKSKSTGNQKFKSGFIALIGRPNSGKSTLVNSLVGEKVSIVSYKPQTTRNRIMGILTTDNYQMVFIDTPGLLTPKNKLGEYMAGAARSASQDTDALVYMVDGEKGLSALDKTNIENYIRQGHQVIIALNKIDRIAKERAGEILTAINDIKGYVSVVPLSALTGKNTDLLIEEILKLLKEDRMYFDRDMYTDKSKRFIAAEIIREKALRLLDEEIPHGVGIVITKFEYRQDKEIVDIEGEIFVEKEQHKPIILGKDGSMIKKISTYARQDLENLAGMKVFLSLWVKVKRDWRDNAAALNLLGYNPKDI
ncbi:MAG: GTPase Era [Christensenellales bacterium]|jgi:GTP-binding protein Era